MLLTVHTDKLRAETGGGMSVEGNCPGGICPGGNVQLPSHPFTGCS